MKESLNERLIALANEFTPSVGNRVLKQILDIPYVVKDALDEYQRAMGQIEDRDSIEELKEAIKRLGKACEANPAYKGVYEAAKKEAQEQVADVIANKGKTLLVDE